MDAICDVTGKYVCVELSKSNVQKTFYVMYMVFQQVLGVIRMKDFEIIFKNFDKIRQNGAKFQTKFRF